MNHKVAVLAARWPAGHESQDPRPADFWGRYFGDPEGGGVSSWWLAQTEGQVAMRTHALFGWFDLQAADDEVRVFQDGRPLQVLERQKTVFAAVRTVVDRWPQAEWARLGECDSVVVVMDVRPDWKLDGGGTTGRVPQSVPVAVTPLYVPRPAMVMVFADPHSFAAHEAGHLFGLQHSFGPREHKPAWGADGEYGDPWCIMSQRDYGGHPVEVDPSIAGFGLGQYYKGPGLNGATRAYRGWASTVDLELSPGLDWTGTIRSLSSPPDEHPKVVRLRAGPNSYTLELRSPADDCDRGFPCPMVLVHHQAGSSADRAYPNTGSATILFELRAGGPGVLETSGFRVHAGPMSRDTRTIRLHVTGRGMPHSPWWPLRGDDGRTFSGKAPVAAVSRRPEHLDLFCVGPDGVARSAWWHADKGWKPWFDLPLGASPLGSGRGFHDESPVTALARRPDHLDIFLTNESGATCSAWYHDLTPQETAAGVPAWRSWFTLDRDAAGNVVSFRQDRPVAAVARAPEHIDLFRIGFNGLMYSCWWHGDPQGWRPWFTIWHQTAFPPEGYVTALARGPDHMDLFAFGPRPDNHLLSAWWHADQEGWRRWQPLFPEDKFRPDQQIAAVARRPEHMDLFAVGEDGAVYNAWFDSADGWHRWSPIHGELHFSRDATVTAVARRPDHMDLYVKDPDGAVWSTWFHEDPEGWRPWYSIHPERRFRSARPVTAVSRYAEHIDLFEIDDQQTDTHVVTSAWPGFTPDVPPPDVNNAVYTIRRSGNLGWVRHVSWMRHLGAWEGGDNSTWAVKEVKSGWGLFARAFSGGNGILYEVREDGDLFWHRHLGYVSGDVSWTGPNRVGNGWQDFARLFADGQGHIYAMTASGDLWWYSHLGWQDGSASWKERRQVGNGWSQFVHIFPGGRGVIYAVRPNGELLWYRHDGREDGSFSWSGPLIVGSGWAAFRAVWAGPEGTIYTERQDGEVLWYRHHGVDSGAAVWSGPKWTYSAIKDAVVVI